MKKNKGFIFKNIVKNTKYPLIDVEQFLIAGVHDHLGGSKVIVKEY